MAPNDVDDDDDKPLTEILRGAAGDVNPEGGREVAAAIEAEGGRAVGHGCDVADEASIRGMIDAAVSSFGGLDILHNNAAASDFETMSRDTVVTDLEVEIWDRAFAVNARGPMLGCKHAIPRMLERGGGASQA